MPELGLFLSRGEEQEFISRMLQLGAILVPDLYEQVDRQIAIRTLADYERFRDAVNLYFVLHPDFTRTPLVKRCTTRDGAPLYYVMQGEGGPVLHFVHSVEFREEGRIKVNPGSLSYYPATWQPDVSAKEPAPPSIKAFYGELARLIRSMSKRVKIGVRTYWIGNEVLSELRTGRKEVGIRGIAPASIAYPEA